MTDTCTIQERNEAVGEAGERLEIFSNVATGVKCRVITIGNRFMEQAQPVGSRETIVDSYRLIVPHDQTLEVDYRVILSSGDTYDVVDLITQRTQATDNQAVIVRMSD